MRNANGVVIVDIVVAAAFNIAGVVAAFVFLTKRLTHIYLKINQTNQKNEF